VSDHNPKTSEKIDYGAERTETEIMENEELSPEINPSAEDETTDLALEESQEDLKEVRNNGLQRKISPVIQSINDWSAMQQTIREYPEKIKSRMSDVEKLFSLYRLTLANLTYKAPQIEEEIWDVYNQIVNQLPILEERSSKRPLFLFTNPGLRDLTNSWDALSAEQDRLSSLLAKAPRGLEFYNRMQIVREQKYQEELRHQENAARIDSAYESLRKALTYVDNQCKNDEPIFYGNEVITLQDAQVLWNEQITEILNLREGTNASTDTMLARLRSLEETVRDYPSVSKQIQRVSERFSRLIAYHDLLGSYGKRIIPQAEIARATAIMFEQIPAMWSNGKYNDLKVLMERVENFLNFYENTVELEVAVGERKRGGFTQNIPGERLPVISELSPMIELTRVMVAAIDQRDRFMVGHSEHVAKQAVMIGKKLDWSGSDIEFLEIAALLHDIGKVSIPETILTKVKPLTNQEWKTIQMHPYYGAQIVKQMNNLNRIVPWVYHHQEHWDGTGYPDQLSKKDIPLAASIIGIAEAFTVMTTDLPYRQSLSKKEALENVKEAAEKQFNPTVTEAFLEVIEENPPHEGESGS
jgi:putative nucleotidyltransferase with HDIG domain